VSQILNKHFRLPAAQLGRAALIILIAWSGFAAIKTYFIDWASAPDIHAAFSQNFKNMALYLNNLPPNVNKYVIANAGGQIMDDGLPVSAEAIKVLTHYPKSSPKQNQFSREPMSKSSIPSPEMGRIIML